MLATFMYHRVFAQNQPQANEAFLQHLMLIAKNYQNVVPGDALSSERLSLCLTFDDAYFDFYYYVFPLLKKLRLKAVVGVSTKFIIDATKIAANTRLAVPQEMVRKDDNYRERVPFCTWQELEEMRQSGLVIVASHSHTHANLAATDVDLEQEIATSGQIIKNKLNCAVNAFVYPYGKTNREVQKKVLANYRYAMRIGSALNRDWHNSNGYIYRIDAEHYWQKGRIPSKFDQCIYYLKYLNNSIRGK